MQEIDALDRSLVRARSGTITLRRLPTVDVTCPASIRGYLPAELVNGITQQDCKVILSPTQINAAVWPGPQGSGPDIRIPSRNRGDLCIINGEIRTVQAAVGLYVQGVLVRIELQVR